MKEVCIGILGFGTVGTGVIEGLYKNQKIISERIGIKISILKIADINLSRDRGINVPNEILTTDANSVIFDKSIDIIVELIGGTSIAKDLVEKSLSLGKPVVTANKALLAEYGEE